MPSPISISIGRGYILEENLKMYQVDYTQDFYVTYKRFFGFSENTIKLKTKFGRTYFNKSKEYIENNIIESLDKIVSDSKFNMKFNPDGNWYYGDYAVIDNLIDIFYSKPRIVYHEVDYRKWSTKKTLDYFSVDDLIKIYGENISELILKSKGVN